ncbi:hypothetical protein EW145_g7770 [Phellinidium pouzarii]|uniref:Inositol oxygenase n=1 Tax=Phellinidium pouzarii TaxID=167371 RepID=A0A4S4KG44_9AGAM|nr:hypothetical protein EW145_g7770 [Phellinidium pouzarii]
MPAILARIGRDFDATSDAEETSEFDAEKDKTHFRNCEEACDRVKDFYREQYEKQTVEFNIKTRASIRKTVRTETVYSLLGVWEAMEKLNTLVDASDPDTELSQIEHLLQTAEAIRRDGKPEWMQVNLYTILNILDRSLAWYMTSGSCFTSSAPKANGMSSGCISSSFLYIMLYKNTLHSALQDTFIVGCAFSDTNVYPEIFAGNPNSHDPVYASKYGIYKPGCGLENVMLSWGHDEVHSSLEQSTLPEEGLAMIRYHSFYPWHREGAYTHLTNAHDMKLLAAVRAFNPYDLYSKSDEPADPAASCPTIFNRLLEALDNGHHTIFISNKPKAKRVRIVELGRPRRDDAAVRRAILEPYTCERIGPPRRARAAAAARARSRRSPAGVWEECGGRDVCHAMTRLAMVVSGEASQTLSPSAGEFRRLADWADGVEAF